MRVKTADRVNPVKTNLWIDLGLPAAILLALTGKAVHEWLSIGLAAAVVVHLLRHWQWVAAVIKRWVAPITRAQTISHPMGPPSRSGFGRLAV